MTQFIYNVIYFIAHLHDYFLGLNDQLESSFDDKQMHFIIFGLFGVALIMVLHPIFLWLAKKGHVMVISFLYVFTVILVMSFAIELGQGFTGTGTTDFDDTAQGIMGFLVFFVIFLTARAIVHVIIKLVKGSGESAKPENQNPADNDYF